MCIRDRLVTGLVAFVLSADVLDVRGLDVGEGGSVAVVAVDAGQLASRRSGDVVKDDMALIHRVAVAAATVELAKVVDSESGDRP